MNGFILGDLAYNFIVFIGLSHKNFTIFQVIVLIAAQNTQDINKVQYILLILNNITLLIA